MSQQLKPRSLERQIKGLRTHATVWGKGPPLVIVVGLGCASWMYDRLAKILAVQQRTVYVYDHPGQGYSQGRFDYPISIDDLTSHLALWLEECHLIGTPLLGHSLGGEVVFNLAAQYPKYTPAIIACAPTGIPENPSLFSQFVRLLLDGPRENPRFIWSAIKAYNRAGFWRIYWLATDQIRHQTGPILPQIKVPTLLLDGLADPIIRGWTVKAIKENINGAVIREVKGGTHGLIDSHPKAVARFVLDFLEPLGV